MANRRGEKRGWLRWEWSLIVLAAFPRHLEVHWQTPSNWHLTSALLWCQEKHSSSQQRHEKNPFKTSSFLFRALWQGPLVRLFFANGWNRFWNLWPKGRSCTQLPTCFRQACSVPIYIPIGRYEIKWSLWSLLSPMYWDGPLTDSYLSGTTQSWDSGACLCFLKKGGTTCPKWEESVSPWLVVKLNSGEYSMMIMRVVPESWI